MFKSKLITSLILQCVPYKYDPNDIWHHYYAKPFLKFGDPVIFQYQ